MRRLEQPVLGGVKDEAVELVARRVEAQPWPLLAVELAGARKARVNSQELPSRLRFVDGLSG